MYINHESNADIIDQTYFDYHGKHDDGTYSVDEYETEVNG